MAASQNIVGQLFPTIVVVDVFGNPTPVPSLGQQAIDLLSAILLEKRRANARIRMLTMELTGTDFSDNEIDEMLDPIDPA